MGLTTMPARCVPSGMNTEEGLSLRVKRTIGTTAASKGLLHVCTPAQPGKAVGAVQGSDWYIF